MSDIQEQLRKIEYVPPDAKDAPLGLYDKKKLEALIQEQVRLARIDELTKFVAQLENNHNDMPIGTPSQYTTEQMLIRLTQLGAEAK